MLCWICGNREATTGEHKIKRTDLKAIFGAPANHQPLRLHDANQKNKIVQGLNASILKSPGKLCDRCNSKLTQPYDRAWEALSNALRQRLPDLKPGDQVRVNRIFPYDTAQHLRHVQLYFTKLFGCHLVGDDIPIDTTVMARSILHDQPDPNVYIKIGLGPQIVGMTDMTLIMKPPADNQNSRACAFALWGYLIQGLTVLVMYSTPGEWREGLVDAWHPKLGTSRIKIVDLRT